jgi:hypothetical protein
MVAMLQARLVSGDNSLIRGSWGAEAMLISIRVKERLERVERCW